MSRKLFSLILVVLVAGLVQTSLAAGLDPNLVAWWSFDEGSGDIAADGGPLGLDGVLLEGPQWRQAGRRDGCLYFDGADDYVRVADRPELNPGTGSFTITFWANIDQTPGTSGTTDWDLPVAKRTSSGSNGYYVGASRAAGASGAETGYKFMLGNTSANRVDTPYVSVPLGEWVFVTAVLDRAADTHKISADGGQTWQSNTPPSGSIAPAGDLGLGRDIGQNNYWVHGLIDDVAFFNRALSDTEVGRLMELGLVPGLARDPVPGHGSTDVLRDTVLSWAPGLYASTHDVYFGMSFDDVSNATRDVPLGVLMSQDQPDSTYDPGRLEFGQTYYWRIDEVNGAPDYTIYEGKVWSFTVEPKGYPIAGVVATTNGTAALGQEIDNIVNGAGLDADDLHSYDGAEMWLADPAADGTLWAQFEFDGVYKLHQMLIWNYNAQFETVLGFGVQDATIEYSTDGIDWTLLGDVTLGQGTGTQDYAHNTTIDFDGAAVKYVKLTVNSGFGTQGQYGLSEVRFLSIPAYASEPEPLDGATNVSVSSSLSWKAGRGVASHEVYLGTDMADLPLAASLQDSIYESPALDLGTTYYWQIVEVNEAEATTAWAGDVWTFSTEDYVVVEDFESYDDDIPAETTIWQTWLDGVDNPANGGSQVGYLMAPFAEMTVVRGGSQSMPLIYDTAGTSYAETVRTFNPPQDWTQHGIVTLTLFFRGELDNTGQLYAKINGVKVPYDGGATDVAKVTWQTWNIDLASLGTNLASVQTLTIGLEGANASGTLYVDDIHLYKVPPLAPREPDSAFLVAHYAFEGDATDVSGNGHDGQIMGEAGFAAGMVGQALMLDGADDFISVPDDASLNPGTGNFSFTFWAQVDPTPSVSGATPTWDMAIGKRQTGSNGYYIGAYRSAGEDDEAGFKFMLGNTSAQRVDTPYMIVPIGEWVFVSAVLDRDQNTHKISVNGGGTWGAATPPVGSIAPNRELSFGFDVGPDNYWFHGMIDEVRLYNKALTDAEVAWIAGDL